MAEKNIHRPERTRDLVQRDRGLVERKWLRRLPVSRKVHSEAFKSGGCKRLTEAKQRLFRGGDSMGEQRDGMRTGTGGGELKRRGISGKGDDLDGDTGFDPV